MKTNRALILLTIASIFLSCNNMSPDSFESLPGKHPLSISLGAPITRTILPSSEGLDLHYQISFSGPEILPDLNTESIREDLFLAEGDWTISVEALDSSDQIVAGGSETVRVPETSIIMIPLNLLKTGSGAVNLQLFIDPPQGISLGTLAGSLTSLADSSSYSLTLDGTESPYTLSIPSIPSGEYFLSVELTSSNGISMNRYMEILWVCDNISTEADINLAQDFFTPIPECPVNFLAQSETDGVLLTWDDVSSCETGFLIERKEDGGTFTEITSITTPNTETYTDLWTNVDDTLGYVYRISSMNEFGVSADTLSTIFVSDPDLLFVAPGGSGSGISWDYPTGDLQAAMELASTSSSVDPQVWVKTGTYTPSSSPAGVSVYDTENLQRNYHFSLTEGIKVFGGFQGNESSLNARDFVNNPTILSGDFNGDDLVTGQGATLSFSNMEENAYHVWNMPESVELQSLLDGFIISGGNANGSGTLDSGGGIYSKSIFDINNTIFEHNRGKDAGGIYIDTSYSNTDHFNIVNCIFSENAVSYNGGAFYSNSVINLRMMNTLFSGNKAEQNGGAMFLAYNSRNITILNGLYLNNFAASASSIYNQNYTTNIAEVYNSVFWNNESTDDLSIKQSVSNVQCFKIENSILEDSAERNYIPESDFTAISYQNPLLLDINNPKGADGVWRTSDDGICITSFSPLINSAGSTGISMVMDYSDIDNDGITSSELLPYDLHLNLRTQQGWLDVGPLESSYIDTTVPELSDMSISTGDSLLDISWTDAVDMDFSQVQISWDSSAGGASSIVDRGTELYQITGLTNSVEYTVTIVAVDYTGNASTTILYGTPDSL